MSTNPTATSTGKAFPTSVDKSEVGAHKPEPNMLGRKDIAHERWTVENCRPVRGEPRTSIDKRIMFAPSTDDDVARAIRGHEMLHAKLSPTEEQMEKWVARGVASSTAMVAVEELRINYLAEHAGFGVKAHLADGNEMEAGERLAQSNDWAGAVATCFATAGTAGHKKFLTGIRRHNRAWGDALLDISKRAMREIKKAHRDGLLARTDEYDGIAPLGFSATERIAEWVDRLASFPPPKDRKSESKSGKGKSKAGMKSDEAGDEDSESVDKSDGVGNEGVADGEGDRNGVPHQNIKPAESTGRAPRWAELRVSREPMPRLHAGTIGKKRIATNMGRRPRRMHRYMTDPAKRVFDRTVRGSGGMVIIDASGSMSFTTEQIVQIVDNAKGATVAIYSDKNRDNGANMWVIADKGRMVENVEYIDYGHGNGVDFPAIVWGVENRQNSKAPLVWVTDGGVCGYNDGFHDLLAMQCIEYAKKHGYIVVPHVEEAIEQLRVLRNGGTARSTWGYTFDNVYRRYMGRNID
jgi:hypothetical protein